MQELSIRNKWIARAEVAQKIQNCEHSEDRMLCAYKILNSLNDNIHKNDYVEALSDYLQKNEFNIVMQEINYDKFDNLSFWVNKTIKDMIDYYNEKIHLYPKNLIIDKMRGAFSIFICDYVSPKSIKIAHELCDAIIKSTELSFLHEVAFFEKTDLDNWSESENKSEDEHYLDLLELEFNAYALLDVYNDECKEERYNSALKQREIKKKEKEISYQLSFKHILESKI